MTLLPPPVDDLVALGVARWKFAGHGRRPVDHVGRDLLFGSLARDYRAWPYHALRQDLPEWAAPAFEPARSVLHDTHRKALTKHLALRLVHDLSLARLAASDLVGTTQAHNDTLNALYACRPVGLAVEWHEPDGRPHDEKCWMNRLCPWCHCRKVVRLYKQLMVGPFDPARTANRVLVMAKVRVVDDCETPEVLTPARVSAVLGRWKPALLRYGGRLGAVGGLVGHQVGPYQVGGGDGHKAFRHDLSLLAEVPCEEGGRWSRAGFEHIEEVAGFGDRPARAPQLVDGATGESLPVEVAAMPMGSRTALRWLLAGSAGHPMWGDPARVTIDRNKAALEHEGRPASRKWVGVDGALALQPSFLYTFDQFFSHRAATSGHHLSGRFGGWKDPSRRDDGEVGRRRVPLAAQGEGLQVRNRQLRQAADEEVGRLLPLAGRLTDELTIALGRRPGRELLARRMAEEGSAVSRRMAVALVEALRGRSAGG